MFMFLLVDGIPCPMAYGHRRGHPQPPPGPINTADRGAGEAVYVGKMYVRARGERATCVLLWAVAVRRLYTINILIPRRAWRRSRTGLGH